MLSKTATYWLAGIGVVGAAAVTPAILKYYHVWPGATDAPAPLLSPSAINAPAATPPSPPAAAPAVASAATPAPAQTAAEPTRAETPPAQQPAAPDKAAPTAVASNKPAQSEQPAAAPSAPVAAPAAAPPASTPAEASAPASPPKPNAQRPAFDVVRVEPTGDAVIAGRASPRAAVQLRSDGRVVAQVDADESGQFAILPPPFPAGGHRLQLAARSGGASEVLSDAIGIEVPGAAEAAAPTPPPALKPSAPSPAPTKPAAAAPPKPVETARKEAATPPKAAPPQEAPKAKPPEPAKVAALSAPANLQPAAVTILSVEADGTGRFEAKGAAEPNTIIRLYLNNAYLADAIASADGRWSLTVERGMTPGAYAIRADEIDRASGAVVARAEAPFNYPDRPAAQVAASTPARGVPLEQAPTRPAQDQAASSAASAAAPAQRPAAPEATPSVAVASPATQPAPMPQVAPAPQAAQPVAEHEAPQTSTPPAVTATAPEQPKANEADVPAKNSSASPNAAPIEPAANPPSASTAAEAPAVAAAEPAKPADSAHPVIPDIRTTKVVRGDNLWNLSKQFYGDGPEYTIIYEANSSQIRNPRLIYPDQIFVVPRKPE